MTVFKLALTNLAMWMRDHFFHATYAHTTWLRLLPFFSLSGRVRWERDRVYVEMRTFNNLQLNCDLLAVCQRVKAFQPQLLDGRLLTLYASSSPFT